MSASSSASRPLQRLAALQPAVARLLLELADDARGGRRADVGHDQRLLEALPGLLVDVALQQRRLDLGGSASRVFDRFSRRRRKNPRRRSGSSSAVAVAVAVAPLAPPAVMKRSVQSRAMDGGDDSRQPAGPVPGSNSGPTPPPGHSTPADSPPSVSPAATTGTRGGSDAVSTRSAARSGSAPGAACPAAREADRDDGAAAPDLGAAGWRTARRDRGRRRGREAVEPEVQPAAPVEAQLDRAGRALGLAAGHRLEPAHEQAAVGPRALGRSGPAGRRARRPRGAW